MFIFSLRHLALAIGIASACLAATPAIHAEEGAAAAATQTNSKPHVDYSQFSKETLVTVAQALSEKVSKLESRVKQLDISQLAANARIEQLTQSLNAANAKLARYETFEEKQKGQPGAVKKQFALEDLVSTGKAELESLIGDRVFGDTRVATIKPIPEKNGWYRVEVVHPTRSDFAGYAIWSGKNGYGYVQIRCVLECEEPTAMRLQNGDEMKVAGNVKAVVVEDGLNFASEEKPGKDRIITFTLIGVKAY